MDLFTSREPHPYGVLPAGNRYFVTANETTVRNALLVRQLGLGPLLHRLSDEILIELLSFLPGESLSRIVLVSAAFYVYGHHGELWRDLALKLCDGADIKYTNNWKDTYVHMRASMESKSCRNHQPLRIEGIYSNSMYRSWACYACDLAISCPGFYTSDIPRLSAKDLTVEHFIKEYEEKNTPLVITSAVEHWPSLTKWTEEYIIDVCSNHKMRATSATAPLPANFTASEYFQYSRQAKEEAPLYLFERNFSTIATSLSSDYDVPNYFASSEVLGTDLFRVFGENRRPDYKWLIAGPARSGSIFHIDPNQTNAWNVCIKGRKKWIFYPPGTAPPGVESSADGADVAVPISTGEWLLSFWRYHREQRNNPDMSKRPLEVILEPGEVIFVPHGYWHMVVNLEDSIAVTHNYVSTSNLSDCLRFLRDTPEQISGVRDRKSTGSVQPESLYAEFLDHLGGLLGKEALDRYVQASHRTSKVPTSSEIYHLGKRRKDAAHRLAKSQSKKNKVSDSLQEQCSDTDKQEEKEKKEFSFGFSF